MEHETLESSPEREYEQMVVSALAATPHRFGPELSVDVLERLGLDKDGKVVDLHPKAATRDRRPAPNDLMDQQLKVLDAGAAQRKIDGHVPRRKPKATSTASTASTSVPPSIPAVQKEKAHERLGGNVTQSEAEPFQQCIEDCNLSDMPSTGALYTWSNKQLPETRVYSRLDRMFVNHEWSLQLPEYCANFLPEGLFDHTPCLVTTTATNQSHNRPFKYYNMWSKASDFKERVLNCWTQNIRGTQMYGVVRKLKLLKPYLKQLNRSHFSAVENQSDLAEIKDHQEKLHTDETGLQQAFLGYYQMLLGSKNQFLRVKEPVVQKGKKIKEVVFSIPNDKAPGPDGYSSQFFKDSWEIVGEEICNAISYFFQSGQLLKQLNSTLLTLISKVARPTFVLEYRPTDYCNVLYKCISKLLCNRLAMVLPDIISQNQGGFIQGRRIMENILIYQDIIRMYEKQVVAPRCMIKMDLQKAYDTIEWEFLDQMLQALKFPSIFRG
ncbi:uncharacterized protein LOC141618193 [Silene latifolia]|uniref:uncharacterized protein LOC141618193 n=1 Tax=Silene latifolia TaxID=37657 RepID=UPI003D783D54